MSWTNEQQQVIDNRDSSILVSAAAGSGKTAVLVERICNKVMDEELPRDIDSFLVVTFTKAAAAQMRDKIASKIEEKLEEMPDNSHLNKQMVLVNRADITTIDSFCMRIVKEYFSLLDMDAAFNIGDNGMMELLKNDTLDQLFDEKYQERDGKFLQLLDVFCGDGEDELLKKEILKIYHVSVSYPRPETWLLDAKNALEVESVEMLEKLPWVERLVAMVHSQMRDALKLVEQAKMVCETSGGPDKNYPIVCEDEQTLLGFLQADTYEKLYHAMQDISWTRMKTCKGDTYNEELIEEFKRLRNSYKDLVKEVSVFSASSEEILEEMKRLRLLLCPLIDLTEEFSALFSEEKRKRKLMDFADVEHLAYRLVCAGYDEAGHPVPTEVGKEISRRYEEIFIDEYQDSNYLQEDILCSVSGMSRGVYNMFMVGDVKQSIYRFRMARPDLFLEKYHRFRGDDLQSEEIKIELKHNFRSRAVVLNAVNFFFYQLMGEDLGGISYDENVALVPAKLFLEPKEERKERISANTEILIADNKQEEGEEPEEELANQSKLELEALMIAGRIRGLLSKDGMDVLDEETGEYRPAEYRDIVILARSIKGFGEILYNTLTAQGIPVYLEDPQGYFDAVEVKLILAFLSVVDNANQDIPLAAVLLSPMGRLDENELARICDYGAKAFSSSVSLYEKCLCYREEKEDELSKKLGRILDIIENHKKKKVYLSISELIWSALEETGYYFFASAMPMGNRRKANINMLLEKAAQFENGYYKGLFHFLRYVEKLRVNDVDFGEANLSNEENAVRIMSMHKSKGLEYPIVFVSGLGKQFNKNERKDNLIVHSDYYLASMVADSKNRYKKKSLAREVFRLALKSESMAEELRIFYVAMTRAKEKLILTGCVTDVERERSKFVYLQASEDRLLPYGVRRNASDFMQWILACMARYESLGEEQNANLSMEIYPYSSLMTELGSKAVKEKVSLEEITDAARMLAEDELYTAYLESFDYQYPYEAYTKIRSKMSISDIKKMKAFDGTEYEMAETAILSEGADVKEIENSPEIDEIAAETGTSPEVVDAQKEVPLSGSERGTLVHKFMELLPFEELKNLTYDKQEYRSFVQTYKNKLLEDKIFDEREAKAVNPYKITTMLMSDLGQRMIRAGAEKKLYKEQQFSIGIPADKIYPELAEKVASGARKDVVIVQGIIDAFFYEGEEIILMDYKTDVASGAELIGKYSAQLDYYGETLERLTGRPVKEKIIYSFYLGEEIGIDFDGRS